jgi:hypothetical protein
LNYSLQQTTKEVLYLPLDRSIRYKVKPFIDMVVFRFGKGIAAVIGIVLLNMFHLPARFLSCVVVPMVGAWIMIAVWLRRDYVIRIRTILQARAAARRSRPPAASTGMPETGADEMALASVEAPPVRKLALADRLVRSREELSLHARELLEELTAYETPLSDSVEGGIGQLKSIAGDQRMPVARRRLAIRGLARHAEQAVVDYLLGLVIVEEDVIIRQEAVRGLVRLRLRRHARLDFPTQPIRRQLEQEVGDYQRILHVAAIYRHHHPGPLAPDDPVIEMLRVLLEESMDQIFRLLMLLYRPEDIHLIYEQLRVADPHVRADAIELLDNLVDPRMRSTLVPILDEDRFLGLLDDVRAEVHEPAVAARLLQGAIWDHNCWLSVTTLCAVGRLRLETMRHELEQAARHTVPVIAKAARVALQLSGGS